MPFVIIAALAGLVVGVLFGQKIKDLVSGVPSTLRADLSKVEAVIVAKVKGTPKPVALPPVAPAAVAAVVAVAKV